MEQTKTIFFSEMLRIVRVSRKRWKHFPRGWDCNGFEDWSLPSATTSKNLKRDFDSLSLLQIQSWSRFFQQRDKFPAFSRRKVSPLSRLLHNVRRTSHCQNKMNDILWNLSSSLSVVFFFSFFFFLQNCNSVRILTRVVDSWVIWFEELNVGRAHAQWNDKKVAKSNFADSFVRAECAKFAC